MSGQIFLDSAYPLVTTEEAVAYLGVSLSFLLHGRRHGVGPSFVNSWKGIRYRREDLDKWMLGGKAQNLTRKEAAAYLGRSRRWLENAACKGYGPKYVIFGKGFLRYPLAELKEYKDAHPLKSKPVNEKKGEQSPVPMLGV